MIVTVETDFELNIAQMGTHPFVHAYQARVPSTSDGVGISCADVMVPAVRTRADWIVVGEVRGGEGGAMVQAMSLGQGAMATVHGGSAKDGLERLAELIAYHNGTELRMARWQVYRSVDLVVHTHGDNDARALRHRDRRPVGRGGRRPVHRPPPVRSACRTHPTREPGRCREPQREMLDAAAARATRRSPPTGGTAPATRTARSSTAQRSQRASLDA